MLQEPQLIGSLYSYRHILRFHLCFILHVFWFNLHLHPHDSCWSKNLASFILDSKLNLFRFIFFTLTETHYLSVWTINSFLTSTAFIKTNNKWIVRRFIEVCISKHCFTKHGWLFKDICCFKRSETNDLPKLNNAINFFFNKSKHFAFFFFYWTIVNTPKINNINSIIIIRESIHVPI